MMLRWIFFRDTSGEDLSDPPVDSLHHLSLETNAELNAVMVSLGQETDDSDLTRIDSLPKKTITAIEEHAQIDNCGLSHSSRALLPVSIIKVGWMHNFQLQHCIDNVMSIGILR